MIVCAPFCLYTCVLSTQGLEIMPGTLARRRRPALAQGAQASRHQAGESLRRFSQGYRGIPLPPRSSAIHTQRRNHQQCEEQNATEEVPRESMEFDVVIVGAGPRWAVRRLSHHATRPGERTGNHCLPGGERFRGGRPHPVRRRAGAPRHERTVSRTGRKKARP